MTDTFGYLKRDQREKFVNNPHGGTRAWFVEAWRIVDGDGEDLVQPWCESKSEAKRLAHQLGITLMGEL